MPDFYASSGKSIRFVGNNSIVRSLWEDNKEYFNYEITFDKDNFEGSPMLIQPKSGRVIGGIQKTEKGFIVFLPAINFRHSSFSEMDEVEGEVWSDKAEQFGARFTQQIVSIHKELSKQESHTPLPQWTEEPQYQIKKVQEIKKKINDIEESIQKLENKKIKEEENAKKASIPIRLLYETGTPLEVSIRACLKELGFKAEHYIDSESEFDVLFSSKEGHFLGEAEGKDTKAINKDKISQLITNIGEYTAKEDTDIVPRGVLFGNGFRLTSPMDREDQFTEKCFQISKAQNIALIQTSDLFPIFLYLMEKKDEAFKEKCRKAIVNTQSGLVKFPKLPKV